MRSLSAFLSYSHADKPVARALAADLEEAGIRVWLDEGELRVGDSIIERIATAITEVDFVAALVSHNSVNSPWCQKELALGVSGGLSREGVKVLPLRIGDVKMPESLAGVLYLQVDPDDLSPTVDQLVRDVKLHSADASNTELAVDKTPEAAPLKTSEKAVSGFDDPEVQTDDTDDSPNQNDQDSERSYSFDAFTWRQIVVGAATVLTLVLGGAALIGQRDTPTINIDNTNLVDLGDSDPLSTTTIPSTTTTATTAPTTTTVTSDASGSATCTLDIASLVYDPLVEEKQVLSSSDGLEVDNNCEFYHYYPKVPGSKYSSWDQVPFDLCLMPRQEGDQGITIIPIDVDGNEYPIGFGELKPGEVITDTKGKKRNLPNVQLDRIRLVAADDAVNTWSGGWIGKCGNSEQYQINFNYSG